MRLSQHGLHTVLFKCLRVKDLASEEFTQNDFVNGVVLTLEEFKKIVDKLRACSDFYYEQTGNVDKETMALFLELFEKLKRVEVEMDDEAERKGNLENS